MPLKPSDAQLCMYLVKFQEVVPAASYQVTEYQRTTCDKESVQLLQGKYSTTVAFTLQDSLSLLFIRT